MGVLCWLAAAAAAARTCAAVCARVATAAPRCGPTGSWPALRLRDGRASVDCRPPNPPDRQCSGRPGRISAPVAERAPGAFSPLPGCTRRRAARTPSSRRARALAGGNSTAAAGAPHWRSRGRWRSTSGRRTAAAARASTANGWSSAPPPSRGTTSTSRGGAARGGPRGIAAQGVPRRVPSDERQDLRLKLPLPGSCYICC